MTAHLPTVELPRYLQAGDPGWSTSADVIVVVIHEGGGTAAGITETSCAGLSGDIVPILDGRSRAIPTNLRSQH